MAFRDLIRAITPRFLLEKYRSNRKEEVRKELEKQRTSGEGYTKTQLIEQLRSIGIEEGDSVLVHSSLSKIGYVEGGAKTVIEALMETVGPAGNILMPTSPNAGLQLEYIRELDIFDVAHTPSALGIITEEFRKLPQAKRSVSATEPVSCVGPDATYFTESHTGQLTPYNQHSPFYKVAAKGGKILYIGVTFANAGTSLHVLEDAVPEFKFPVYYPELFHVNVRLSTGEVIQVRTSVHNPEWSAKRKCDELIPVFGQEGVLKQVKLGNASTLLVDAQKMLQTMIALYEKEGVTMYTPKGV